MAGANISVCPNCGSTQTRVRIFDSHMEARGECKACLYKGPKVKASVRGDLPLACEIAMELFSTDVEKDGEADGEAAKAGIGDIAEIIRKYLLALCNEHPRCDGCPLRSGNGRNEDLPFGCRYTQDDGEIAEKLFEMYPSMDWSDPTKGGRPTWR